MVSVIKHLSDQVPIVRSDGTPTPYFARLLEEISDAKIAASVIDAMGGDPDADMVVVWDDAAGDLVFLSLSDMLDWIDDTHGAILYRDSAGWAALAPGTDGDVLTTHGASADPTWETPSGGSGTFNGAMVKKSADQTAANYSTELAITWDAEVYDTNAWHNLTSTVTITIASPGVITWNAHGLHNNAPVVFTTTGALPTGLTAGTTYYVVSTAANTFSVATAPGGAAINTSGTQSGTHTATNTSILRVPSGVNYVQVGCSLAESAVTANVNVAIKIQKNGTENYDGVARVVDSSSGTSPSNTVVSGPVPVVAGDDFEATLITSDTSTNIIAANSNFWIMAVG